MSEGDRAPDDREEERILWFTKDRSAWFLVPAGVELPEGPFLVRDLKGVRRRVDPEALGAWSVSEAEARRVVGARLDHAWHGLRDALGQVFGETNPLPEDLEGVLGVDPGRMGTDPAAAKEVASKVGAAVQGWLRHLSDDLDKAADDAGGAVKRARQRYEDRPAERLKGDLGRVLGGLGDRLRDLGARLAEDDADTADPAGEQPEASDGAAVAGEE